MRRVWAAILATGILLVAAPSAFAGGNQQVVVQDDAFVDAVERFEAGGPFGFVFDWGAGTLNPHNVRQDDRLFYSGAPKQTGTFDLLGVSAGTFPYYCEFHGNGIMEGVLKVEPDTFAPPGRGGTDSPSFGVVWATKEALTTGDQFDVRYRVNDGPWRTWKQNTSRTQAIFGGNGRPVEVRPGRDYSFKARSELASNPRRASKFSPARTATLSR
jgi:hypothetical protein